MKLFAYLLPILGLAISLNAFELPPQAPSSQDANTMTDMVQGIARKVKNLRDRIITIDPEKDTQAVQAAVQEIQGLEKQVQDLNNFVHAKKAANPDFINQLNDEGMPPRIVEGEIELSFRHDLNAIGMSLGIGNDRGTITEQGTLEGWSEDLSKLVQQEDKIYDTIENLHGPLIRFKNLKNRYPDLLTFFAENKRYTPQEAHVILHIATYVIAVREALALAPKDGGRYLLNLLKTYVAWLPWGTHLDEDVEVIKMHGSIMSITDKNNKTMLDWTNELINNVKDAMRAMERNHQPTKYLEESLQQLQQIAIMLKGTLPTDTGELKKIPSRSLLRTEKSRLDELGLKPYMRPMSEEEKAHIARMKGLGLETERELLEVSDIATLNPELQKNQQ